nr:DUF1643 domain-containing protein [Virgibacillus halodenitrificans]
MGNFKTLKSEKGIAVTSADETKRYYYQEGNPVHFLLMFNASTVDGNDRTVDYVREVNRNFGIINLIPSVASKPEKLKVKDLVFNPINFQVIQKVLNETGVPIWIGWGELVKKKTDTLIPSELRDLLTIHKKRLVQIDRGKPRKWFPMHPAYAKINIPAGELKLTPFDVKYVLKYK